MSKFDFISSKFCLSYFDVQSRGVEVPNAQMVSSLSGFALFASLL